MLTKALAVIGLSNFFTTQTPEEMLLDQQRRIERAYLSHLAAAETHQMMAQAYRQRLETLHKLQRDKSLGIPLHEVSLVDPMTVYHQVSS